MKPDARQVAVRFLLEVLAGRRRSDALSRDPGFLRLERRDRRLCMTLAQGTLRRLKLLDHRLERLSRRPLVRLDREVLGILRLAAYEMGFLRTPAHAAVHQAVSLCRVFGKSSAKAFVNAILRRLQRDEPAGPEGDSAEALAVRHSHPDWLAKRYVQRWGPGRADALMRRNNAAPRPPLWVNPFRIDFERFQERLLAEGTPFRVHPDLPLCLEAPSALARSRWTRGGYCFFMDAGSQATVAQVDLSGVRRAGDFCAAPGGKAILLASRLPDGATLCAADVSWRRLRRLQARARLCRAPMGFVQADLTRPGPCRAVFDFILLDVPCSGLGTLGANPEIRWRVREEDLLRHHARQVSILRHGFAALRPGGRLLYSTCSTEPEENEQALEAFRASEPRAMVLGPPRRNFPEGRGQCFFSALVGHAE